MNHKSTRSKAQRRDAGINCELLEAELFRLRQHAAGRNHAADLCGGRARLHTYASVQRRNRCQRREGEPELHRGGNKRARRQRGCRKLSKAKRCPKNNNGFYGHLYLFKVIKWEEQLKEKSKLKVPGEGRKGTKLFFRNHVRTSSRSFFVLLLAAARREQHARVAFEARAC